NITVYEFIKDTTKPVFTPGETSVYYIADDILLVGNDSWIKSIEWNYNGGSWEVWDSLSQVGLSPGIPGNLSVLFNASIQQDGCYQVRAVDWALNYSTIVTIYLDRSAPEGSFSNINEYMLSKTSVRFSWILNSSTESPVSASLTYLGIDGDAPALPTNYLSNELITNEGFYLITLSDLSGNTTYYSFEIDLTKTTSNLNSQNNVVSTNQSITYIASDRNFSHIEYSFNNSDYTIINSDTLYLNGLLYVDGAYRFKAIDLAGNISDIVLVYLDRITPTGTLSSSVNVDGYSKTTVTFTWLNADSTQSPITYVTLTYYEIVSGITTEVTASYAKGAPITAEHEYFITLVDAASNQETISFIIDKTKPVGIALSTYYNNSFTFSATDNWEVKSYQYRLTTDTLWITSLEPITLNTSFKEGTYQFKAIDLAGNESDVYTTIFDYSAPVLNGTLPGFTNSNISYITIDTLSGVNKREYRYDGGEWIEFNGSLAKTSGDGLYEFRSTDNAGNISNIVSIVLDTINPQNGTLPQYTNEGFTYIAYDDNLWRLEYKVPGSVIWLTGEINGVYTSPNGDYGTYSFRAIDLAGNVSSIVEVILWVQNNFGNLENIKNYYKVDTWYVVNLPANIFSSDAGQYSFSNYDSALNFAVSKEFFYRVNIVGNHWTFPSIQNESILAPYYDMDSLYVAINFYAKRYVSNELNFEAGVNNYYTIMSNYGIPDASALTNNNLTVPEFILNEYSGLSGYFLNLSYQFLKPNSLAYPSIEFLFIASTIELVYQSPLNISYGINIKNYLQANNYYFEGYYKVKEFDLAGNYQEYIVFIDLTAPVLNASVTRGDGEAMNVVFNSELVAAGYDNKFISFDITSIFDYIDDYYFVRIIGKDMNKTFRIKDFNKIPILDGVTYFGNYNILVF
ncbi:MAG: hypothetical protein LBV51_05410, partial [Acholeplasmatales bacterium]|nr:hypothetical protein [Acholeplasmatales bacterium]